MANIEILNFRKFEISDFNFDKLLNIVPIMPIPLNLIGNNFRMNLIDGLSPLPGYKRTGKPQ